jgi:ankyrin repeat protein
MFVFIQNAWDLDLALRSFSGGGGAGLLHWACEIEKPSVREQIYDLLFQKIFELNDNSKSANILWRADQSGATPFHWAAGAGMISLLKRFLAPNVIQLYELASQKYSDQMISDDHQVIDIVDSRNETALSWAVVQGQFEVGAQLLHVLQLTIITN